MAESSKGGEQREIVRNNAVPVNALRAVQAPGPTRSLVQSGAVPTGHGKFGQIVNRIRVVPQPPKKGK